MKTYNDYFVERNDSYIVLCTKSGQRVIMSDKNIVDKTDDEIITNYQKSLNCECV